MAARVGSGAGRARRIGVVHGLLLLSGFAGLGYQVVWTRMLAIGLGHEVFAVLAVVAAFFGGLTVGAVALAGPVARSRRPGLWYAGLEAAVGLWALLLTVLIPLANGRLADLIGTEPTEAWRWAVAFLGPMLLLLPATAAMGATLPAAERFAAADVGDGQAIGGLYAANAAGAMVGALLTAVWLAPALGFAGTLAAFAAVNLLCAALALPRALGPQGRAPASAGAAVTARPPLALTVLFVSGLLGIGYEVAAVRALSQLLENTVYSFAAALTVYLLGTALGAAGYQRAYGHRRGAGFDVPALGWLVSLTALAGVAGGLGVFAVADVVRGVRALLGGGLVAGVAAELVAVALVLGPASAAMGALFAHLVEAGRGRDGGLGAAFAANTAGAAAAPLLVGVLAIPAVGTVHSLYLLSLMYLLLFALVAPWSAWRGWGRLGRLAAAPAMAALVQVLPLDARLVAALPGGRVLAHQEGVAATATVVEDAGGNRYLKVNGTFLMGGTATYAFDRLMGHVPLLHHPDPRRALYLGVGTGATLAAAGLHPGLRADAVELLPEVLALIPEFPAASRDLGRAGDAIRLHVADARRWVRADPGTYNVVIADNYHPAKDGSGLLYTAEHFTAVRERLNEGGTFVQWLPLHQLDLDTLQLIARTFLAVFPDARAHLGNASLATPVVGLYGSRNGRLPALGALMARPMGPALAQELAGIGLDGPFALFGGFLGGPAELRRFAGDGPLNTDDRPLVLFRAPRTVYAPLGPPAERVLALIQALHPQVADAVDLAGLDDAEAFAGRLAAYWRARDTFLTLGAENPTTGDLARDRAALAPRLLAIVKTSQDFSPAVRPLLAIARLLAGSDRAAALGLLDELAAAAPDRPEVAALRATVGRQN